MTRPLQSLKNIYVAGCIGHIGLCQLHQLLLIDSATYVYAQDEFASYHNVA